MSNISVVGSSDGPAVDERELDEYIASKAFAKVTDLSGFQKIGPKPTGVATTDIANCQSLLDSLDTFGGGALILQDGEYTMYLDIPRLCSVIGSGEGATEIKLPDNANRNVLQTKGFVGFDTAKNTMSVLDGVPHGVRIENLRVNGNRENNNIGTGVAWWTIRSTMKNVYIRNCAGGGFYSNGIDGTTGSGFNGQCENIVENVWINGCKGVGYGYYGPHDGYSDKIFVYGDVYGSGLANAAELGNTDVGYIHVYGGRIGVVLKGNTRIDHLESENNMREAFITQSNGSQTNSITRATIYGNWTSGPTSTDYSFRIENRVDIGDLMIRCDHGENGLLVSGANAAGTTIRNFTITGTGAAQRHGLNVVADRVDLTGIIDGFSTGWQRYSNNSFFRIRAQNTSYCGYYEPDATGAGNQIYFNFRATASQHIPWILPATLADNFYSLISSGQVSWKFNGTGQDERYLTNGEVTYRDPTSSSIALTSGTLQLTYFTARRSTPVNTVQLNTGGVAAGATPTLCRMGIYSVASNGDLTLVASTPNDTSLFASTFAGVNKPLSAPWNPAPGQRYAFGILVTSAAAMPQFYGDGNMPGGASATNPRKTGQVAGLTDLPTTITSGTVTPASKKIHAQIIP